MLALKRHCSTLTSVFKYKLLELQDSFVLRNLTCSFERPQQSVELPSWDLVTVLEYLPSLVF